MLYVKKSFAVVMVMVIWISELLTPNVSRKCCSRYSCFYFEM